MCNIHCPGKDIRLRDSDSKVFKHQDERFEFLSKFCSWLENWKIHSCTGKAGKLNPQTFTSLIHTTKVIPKIINHLTSDECGFSYVLTGFSKEAFWCVQANVWLPIQRFLLSSS